MSHDVDVIRRTYEVWNEAALAEWKAMHHEDVVVIPPSGWPEGEPTADRDAWFTQAMRLTDSWEDQRIEVESYATWRGVWCRCSGGSLVERAAGSSWRHRWRGSRR